MNTFPRNLFYRQASTMLIGILLVASTVRADDLPFTTATVELDITPLERLLDGTVEAVNQATMSAQTSGRVAEVFYDVDDYVEPGATIVRFSDVEQQAALRQANAALAEALARSKQADVDFTRIAGLLETGAASKREYDQAVASNDTAKARVAAAQSAVESARQQVEYTLVRAPYAGIVTERHVEVGEAVGVGQPLMSGLSLEALRVIVDLPQQAAPHVREHRSAFILTDEGRLEAAAITLFPYAHSESNTFRVRLELPEGQHSLFPGMFVKVGFVVGEARRLLIPADAIVRRSELSGVYATDGDRVALRQVRLGRTFGGSIEVLSGLDAGESVALDPVEAAIWLKEQGDQ